MSLGKEFDQQRRSSIQHSNRKNGIMVADSKVTVRNKISNSLSKHVVDKTLLSKRQAEIKNKTDTLLQQFNTEEQDFENLLKLLRK